MRRSLSLSRIFIEQREIPLFRLGLIAPILVLVLASCRPALATVPSFSEVKSRWVGSEARLYDRNGELIQEQRSDLKFRRLEWTRYPSISPALIQAVLQSEDQRFFQHAGVDWMSLAAAVKQNFLDKSKRGASTLSMQVAALLDQNLRPRGKKRNWVQKISQIQRAQELERSWSKEQIFEAYLNLISFRGELQGVASASYGLFGKSPSGLGQAESLILASLIRAPEATAERVIERACQLASRIQNGAACDEVRARVEKQGLLPRPFSASATLAPHAAQILWKEKLEQSTLDRRVQSQVLEILRRHVLSLKDRNMNDAAALVVENKTGKVLAYVGGLGSLSTARAVDGVRAMRQAGSTLKPFIYALAIDKKYLTAHSRLDDSEGDISLGLGAVYHPKDFDREYHGDDVTLRLALASSLNIPAVRTLQWVGVSSALQKLNSLGFQRLKSEEYYGPSLALGTADVTLWELVNAYRTLANQGMWSSMTLSEKQLKGSEKRKVYSSGASFIVSDILADQMSRSQTFGLDSPLGLRFWSAAKTGTSKDMRDNWCIGYSSRYTVGVWAGNFSGASMWNVTGVSGAAPAWAEIMELLHQPGKDLAPMPPAGVVFSQGEYYLRGTEPNFALVNQSGSDGRELIPYTRPKIKYPVEGLMIARDPDIPEDHQRVVFEATASEPSLYWVLNQKKLGPAGGRLLWKVDQPGSYRLELMDAEGRMLDWVRFFVKA